MNENNKSLQQKLIEYFGTQRIENASLPLIITNNLNPKFKLRPYQERAFKYFLNYLKQFRIDGYSKEVRVLQTDAEPFDRALQAVLLSQYRRKIFEKNRKTIKPVILFKSKTINESKDFKDKFIRGIATLTSEKLSEIEANTKDEFLIKMFKYFASNKISLDNLIIELKEDFSAEKSLSINSKEESEDKQLAVNTLEDPNNEYRAIFAVDKLNEGWDVLNLFDIVRLYDTRDAKNNVTGPTTIKEAQLIGRGARYCPFKINEDDDPSQRKFDHDIQNEMRICEELYYHSTYNPRYIQELTSVLIKTGIVPEHTVKRNLIIKEEFKNTKFYKTGLLFLNYPERNSHEDVFGLPSSFINTRYYVSLRTRFSLADNLFTEAAKKGMERKEKDFFLQKEISKVAIKKALYKLDFYSFANLKKRFPHLETLAEFIEKKEYLGEIKATVSGLASQLEESLAPESELEIATKVFAQIASGMSSQDSKWRGSKEFKHILLRKKIDDKELNFAPNESRDKELGKSMNNIQETKIPLDLNSRPWHVFNDCFGTSGEKYFVKYIDKVYDKLREKYDEVYLVRNERFFKLYNFEDGRPLEPDYVLFLRRKTSSKTLYYQVFIEPKGSYLKDKDSWKEQFLVSLEKEHKIEQLWEDKEYRIWGMPFYNNAKEKTFNDEFSKLL